MNSTENVSNADEILDRELAQEIFAKEIYLPWVHENHPFCVGHYFGYVDYARRPHGPNGTWTCACPFEGRAYQVKGRWYHGSIISDEKKKSLLLKTNHSQHNATGDRDDRNSKSHSKNDTTAGDDASIEIYQYWRSSRQTLQDSLSRRNNLIIDVKDEVDSFYIYCVGYRLRSQQHAMETGDENLKSIKKMSNYQFAFIKRSDSTWTYAFLSRRFFQPRGVSNYNKQRLLEESEVVQEEAMEFVVEVYKSSRLEANAVDKIITKVIPESNYGSFIRCRSPDIFGRVTSEKDVDVGDNRERRGIYEWVSSSTKSRFTARSA